MYIFYFISKRLFAYFSKNLFHTYFLHLLLIICIISILFIYLNFFFILFTYLFVRSQTHVRTQPPTRPKTTTTLCNVTHRNETNPSIQIHNENNNNTDFNHRFILFCISYINFFMFNRNSLIYHVHKNQKHHIAWIYPIIYFTL